MNKEEKDVIDFLRVSAITKISKIIISKEDVKYLLNYINELQNKLASKQKQIKLMQQCDLAKELDKLQKENEELKNADLTSVYMKGFYDSESKWKTKIKAKIKELEDKKEQYIEQPLIYHILKNQLEELLGDE